MDVRAALPVRVRGLTASIFARKIAGENGRRVGCNVSRFQGASFLKL
jgi:hypothetical protein